MWLSAKIQNLSDRLRRDSVARRIQNDQIRLFFQLVHLPFEDIPRQKFAVAKSVARRILTGCLDCFPTISTPTTFSATGARICAIVPVPL